MRVSNIRSKPTLHKLSFHIPRNMPAVSPTHAIIHHPHHQNHTTLHHQAVYSQMSKLASFQHLGLATRCVRICCHRGLFLLFHGLPEASPVALQAYTLPAPPALPAIPAMMQVNTLLLPEPIAKTRLKPQHCPANALNNPFKLTSCKAVA